VQGETLFRRPVADKDGLTDVRYNRYHRKGPTEDNVGLAHLLCCCETRRAFNNNTLGEEGKGCSLGEQEDILVSYFIALPF